MPLFHAENAALQLFFDRRAGCHGQALQNRFILHLAAGQEGRKGRSKPEHAHIFEDGRTGFVSAQQFFNLFPFPVVPEHQPCNQRRCQQNHQDKRKPAEAECPMHIAVAGRRQASRQVVVDITESRKHQHQQHRQHRDDQHQHCRRVGYRVVQLFRNGFLILIIDRQPEKRILKPAGLFAGFDHLQGIVRENAAFLHCRGQTEALIYLFFHHRKALFQHAAAKRPVALQQAYGLVGRNARLDHHGHAFAEGADTQFIQFFSAHLFTACYCSCQ